MNWHDYFTYDEATGNLIWKTRPREHFKTDKDHRWWNKRYPGTIAGCKVSHRGGVPGWMNVTVYGVQYSAQNIVWEMFNGPVPEGKVIDHIDGDPWNNRRSNHRPATHKENGYNKGVYRNNKSGIPGVIQRPCGKFRTFITKDQKRIWLGQYATIEEAKAIRDAAAKFYFGEFARILP